MKRNLTSESFDSPDALSPGVDEGEQPNKMRKVSPPEFIETKKHETDIIPALGELDLADTSFSVTRRLRSYRSMRHVWQAFMMWVILLAFSLSKGKVEQRGDTMHLDMLFKNSTMFPYFEHHLSRINQSIRIQNTNGDQRLRPGELLAKEGARAKYPIVMIPGFVTSGLELWEGHDCAKKYFRQKLWGALGPARSFFTETECWMKHLSLDPVTGMDPPGIRLRTAQGFEAADYFMTAYWVWNKLIENLAELGYDGSNMSMEPYDWRLSYPLLEERDGYFTKLMYKIEAMHKTNGNQVVIASHSMGSPLMTYFFAWVAAPENEGGGGGGQDWVDKHVHTLINIAGPMLGVPKAIPSIMSGEMKDTAAMMGIFGTMVEGFCGRRRRKQLWSSWGSLWAMLPKGGNHIWGVGADICGNGTVPAGLDCVPAAAADLSSLTPFLSFTDEKETTSNASDCKCVESENTKLEAVISAHASTSNWSIDETLSFMGEWGVGHGANHSGAKSLGVVGGRGKKLTPLDWNDPTRTPLPHAPSMKIYCLYGVGMDTERSFFYKQNLEHVGTNDTECAKSPIDLPFIMDGSIENQAQNIQYGARMVDGDASVPLLSLGYMCVDGWKRGRLNPSGSRVITREYKHQGEFSVDDPMRGGPKSAEHVDILGNLDMTEDFLRIVTDFQADEVQDQIFSDIHNIADRINSHPLGGLKAKESKLRSLFKKRPSKTA